MTVQDKINEFRGYLNDNFMSYRSVTPYVVDIDGKTFELYEPSMDGAIFDDSFAFTGIPVDPDHKGTIETSCDFYAYKFGGVWYMLPKGAENDVKLKRLKYLGHKAGSMFEGGAYLGVHGQYEILSGSGQYSEWCDKAKFLGYETLGICELNSLAGALKFQQECKKKGLKPVIGMECTVFDESAGYKFTVKVFVRNQQGWHDILTINKFINCDNPKYISLKDFNAITRKNENLVLILDPKTLDYGRLATLRVDTILYQLDPVEYTDDERDRVYLENLKKFFDSKLQPVAMTDAWYLDREYSSIRQRLNAIGGIQAYDSDDQYMKSDEEVFEQLSRMIPPEDNDILQYFFDVYSEARDRLLAVVDGIDFEIDSSHRHLPRYIMTPEESEKYADNTEMFWGLISDGLERHPELVEEWGEDVVMDRIEKEVDTIEYGDTVDYFLITRDIVNWSHENDIMTGISRGSAGGCLISYLLGITKLDPLKYNLLFERFLNKGRVQKSLPDIDCDFSGNFRDKVKKYMEERFGFGQVASVGTYSALQLRAAIKDMSRLYGLQYQEVNDMMKLFSVDDRKPEDLFRIACANSKVKKFVLDHPDLINEVMLVMPAPKAQSIHACATMIFPTENDMFHWVPIRKVGGEYVTEWEGTEMDAAGFLKQDILGIKQLDKFQEMVALIRENEGEDIDIFNVPLDDPEVYRYFQNGWTEDNFHFGSKGLTGYCKKMKPENIEDLIAAISLYRPGAMENGFHEDYIKRKNGNDGEPIEYWVGAEQALKGTYGVIVYQEQVMELCRTLGGLSMVEADDVRKAMVKKKYEALAQYHERFTPYYMENFGVTKEYAENVWDAIDKASSYLFNRSHAAAYAITGYISQWLKVHYPIEYWSVAFHYAQEGDAAHYIAEINKTGVCEVKPVNINVSSTGVVIDFERKALYWSLMGVKQVAERAAEQILKERSENGQYWSFNDFIQRHKWKGSAINSRVVKNLILSGAFDEIENISEPYGRIKLLIRYLSEQKSKIDENDIILKGCDKYRNVSTWWSLLQKQVSGLAFFDYANLYEQVRSEFPDGFEYKEVSECIEDGAKLGFYTIGGYLTDIDIKTTKSGSQLVKLTLENNYDFIDVLCFSTEWERINRTCNILDNKGSIFFMNGQLAFDKRSGVNMFRLSSESAIQFFSL